MASGTLAPWFCEQFFDDSGNPLNGGTLEVFIAGTSSHAAVYSDVGLTTPYANPLTLNSAGRLPSNGSMFLSPGASYKIVVKTSAGVTITSPDNILAVPGSSSGVDVVAVAGEAITAGQTAYLSAGTGGKIAGQWYKGDSTNTYSSTIPIVGMALASIAQGASGTVRLSGSVTGLTSLTIGARYYVGVTGAITNVAPTNARILGDADTTSSLVLTNSPPPVTTFNSPTINTSIISNTLFAGICNGRLTLTTGVPVTTADVTAATTLRFTPYLGSEIALYDGSTAWTLLTFTELSIAVPATTSQMYDVFVFNNSGTPTLELLAWTNDTTRATALTTQNGALVKSGATTRLYVGSFRTTTVSGQTEDSSAKRYVWNYYNRVARRLRRVEAAVNWTYGTATWRQANANSANQVDIVLGVAEVLIELTVAGFVQNTSGVTVNCGQTIGEDSTSSPLDDSVGFCAASLTGANLPIFAFLRKYPAVGRHFYAWIEIASGGNVTFSGSSAFIAGDHPGGMIGSIMG